MYSLHNKTHYLWISSTCVCVYTCEYVSNMKNFNAVFCLQDYPMIFH